MVLTVFYIAQGFVFLFGVVCFVALYFIPAGYGKMLDKKWGFSFNNKAAWFLMEVPTLITMITLFVVSPYRSMPMRGIIAGFFLAHYAQRVLVFPFILRGKSSMPLSIVAMGITFNTLNTVLIGGWLFYLAPEDYYRLSWLYDPRFILGAALFITGMTINIKSDAYIRSLRKPRDTAHYFPCRGLYAYVSSANYFGETLEWIGFAILSWSIAGALFAFWTMANLMPRAYAINKKYRQDFPDEFARCKPKCMIPFVY